MSWRDLLTKETEIVLPWYGGRYLFTEHRTFSLEGRLPQEHGWYRFTVGGGTHATVAGPAEPDLSVLKHRVTGYLIGDRVVADDAKLEMNAAFIASSAKAVRLIEPGLDLFCRISAGSARKDAEFLVYIGQEMPIGPEDEVLSAFLDKRRNLDGIKSVTPALETAFRFETWQRAEVERRRVEVERRRREEEERLAREARRRELVEKLGDGLGRRAMAKHDFGEAAKAALLMGGAEYLDHRVVSTRRNEYVVRFRLEGRRFECVCDDRLAILDSGICLTAHDYDYEDGDFDEGIKGDTWFTLESLPLVIKEAIREHKLVVYRHA